MMMTIDKLKRAWSNLEECQANKRRLRQLEIVILLRLKERIETRVLLFLRQRPPIVLIDPYRYPPRNHLKRLLQVLPHKRRTQRRMPIHNLLPRAFKRLHVEIFERAGDMRYVDSMVLRVETVEEQPLLHWRKGINILNVLCNHFCVICG